EHGHAASQGAQQFVQSFVDRRVEGMTWAYEHRVEVLIKIEVLLVKRDLPVRRLGLAESSDGGQTIGPKISQDVLDPPEAVGARLHLEPDLAARGEEVLLDVAGHQPPLFHFNVCPLESRTVDVRFRQCDASCL